jgi:hypothetical protein
MLRTILGIVIFTGIAWYLIVLLLRVAYSDDPARRMRPNLRKLPSVFCQLRLFP